MNANPDYDFHVFVEDFYDLDAAPLQEYRSLSYLDAKEKLRELIIDYYGSEEKVPTTFSDFWKYDYDFPMGIVFLLENESGPEKKIRIVPSED